MNQTIITDWYDSIQAGQSTDDVAARHGLTARAIQYWLLSDPAAETARGALIHGELARTLDEMRAPADPADDSPLRLARAREEFRAWSWIAERREARLYGPQIAVKNEVVIVDRDVGLLASAHDLLRLFHVESSSETVTVEAIPVAAIEEKR